MKTAAAFVALALASANAFEWEDRGKHTSKFGGIKNPTICDNTVKQYAGTYEIDNGAKSYFFWSFEARNKSADTPTILWMTGGPGCSSGLAMLYENGPCHVHPDGATTYPNHFSWNNNANIIYIDQPAGVGFSTGSLDDHDETGVSNDMYAFLQDFFRDHPDWNTKFYVFGESYGGHYAPATAHRVWRGGGAVKINLAGLGVGNGLTQPEVQYKYYGQMAYNWSIEVQGKPVITLEQYKKMEEAVPACISSIHECNNGGTRKQCSASKNSCTQTQNAPYTATGLNPYDIRKPCPGGGLCYNFTAETDYLNNAEVQAAIGVNKPWKSCNLEVNLLFSGDWMKNYETMVSDLLNGGIRVMVYAGDVDFICNWIGNKAWAVQLPWSGKSDFENAADKQWDVNGAKAGWVRSAKGFTFLQVHLAGHMVPADQPAAALSMVETFIQDRPF